MNHKLDTDTHVFFYEQEFYVLSNFSSFRVNLWGHDFDTSEHAYHWMKFPDRPDIQEKILRARSAHDAFKIAREYGAAVRPDWKLVRVNFMRDIIRAKHDQHEYVRRKLGETGARTLVEDAWRDSFWGWGPDKNGENWLGALWEELREEVNEAALEKERSMLKAKTSIGSAANALDTIRARLDNGSLDATRVHTFTATEARSLVQFVDTIVAEGLKSYRRIDALEAKVAELVPLAACRSREGLLAELSSGLSTALGTEVSVSVPASTADSMLPPAPSLQERLEKREPAELVVHFPAHIPVIDIITPEDFESGKNLDDPEAYRREKPSCSTMPLQVDQGAAPLDYASAGVLIDKAMSHLDEALPTGQKFRGETAMKLLHRGVEELSVWMRARGYDV